MRLFVLNYDIVIDQLDNDHKSGIPIINSLLNRLSVFNNDQVAIVSRRDPAEVAKYINVPDIFIGGFSGLQWRLPSGLCVGPYHNYEEVLFQIRNVILDEVLEIASKYNLGVNDSLWTLSIETTSTKTSSNKIFRQLQKVCRQYGLVADYTKNRTIDIMLIPQYNMSIGLNFITSLFNIRDGKDSVYFTGYDLFDKSGLWWTILFGGVAITFGECLLVPGSIYAKNEDELVSIFNNLIP